MQILFVCTGNICRSPFAEALSRQISLDQDDTFVSAGTIALAGHAASSTGMMVADKVFGVDMHSHRAADLTADVLATADIVYVMEQGHAAAVLALDPHADVELLSPDGSPIPDPYGGDESAYRQSYSLIQQALTSRMSQRA